MNNLKYSLLVLLLLADVCKGSSSDCDDGLCEDVVRFVIDSHEEGQSEDIDDETFGVGADALDGQGEFDFHNGTIVELAKPGSSVKEVAPGLLDHAVIEAFKADMAARHVNAVVNQNLQEMQDEVAFSVDVRTFISEDEFQLHRQLDTLVLARIKYLHESAKQAEESELQRIIDLTEISELKEQNAALEKRCLESDAKCKNLNVGLTELNDIIFNYKDAVASQAKYIADLQAQVQALEKANAALKKANTKVKFKKKKSKKTAQLADGSAVFQMNE